MNVGGANGLKVCLGYNWSWWGLKRGSSYNLIVIIELIDIWLI